MKIYKKLRKLVRSPIKFFSDSWILKKTKSNKESVGKQKARPVINEKPFSYNSFWNSLEKDSRTINITSGSRSGTFKIKSNNNVIGLYRLSTCMWFNHGCTFSTEVIDFIRTVKKYQDPFNQEDFLGFRDRQLFWGLIKDIIFPQCEFEVNAIFNTPKNIVPSSISGIQNHIFINPTNLVCSFIEKACSSVNIIVIIFENHSIPDELYKHANNDWIIISERQLNKNDFHNTPAILTINGSNLIADSIRHIILSFSDRPLNYYCPIFFFNTPKINILDRSLNKDGYDGILEIDCSVSELQNMNLLLVTESLVLHLIGIHVREEIYLRFFYLHNNVDLSDNNKFQICLRNFLLTTFKYGVRYDIVEYIAP